MENSRLADKKNSDMRPDLYPPGYPVLNYLTLLTLLVLAGMPLQAAAGSERWLTYFNADANKTVYNPSQDTGTKFDAVFAAGQPQTGIPATGSLSDTRYNALGMMGVSRNELGGICDRFGVGGALAVASQVADAQTATSGLQDSASGSKGLQQVAQAVSLDPQAFTHMLSGPVTQAADMGRISGVSTDYSQPEDAQLLPMNFFNAMAGASEATAVPDATQDQTGQMPAVEPSSASSQESRPAAQTGAEKTAVGTEDPMLRAPGQAPVIDGAEVITALDTSAGDLPKIESGRRATFAGLRSEVDVAMDPGSKIKPTVRIHRLEARLEEAKVATQTPGGSIESRKAESRQIVIAEGALFELYESLDPADAAAMNVDKEEKLEEIKDEMEKYAAICGDPNLNSFISSITSSQSPETDAVSSKSNQVQDTADEDQEGAVSAKSALTAALTDKRAGDTDKSGSSNTVGRSGDSAKSAFKTAEGNANRTSQAAVGGGVRADVENEVAGQIAGQMQAKTADAEILSTRALAAEDVKKASVNGEALKKTQTDSISYIRKETLVDTDRKKDLGITLLQNERLQEEDGQHISQNYKTQDLQALKGVNTDKDLNQAQVSGATAFQLRSETPAQNGQPAAAGSLRNEQANVDWLNLSGGQFAADIGILRGVDHSTLGLIQAALAAGPGTPEFKKLVEQYQDVIKTIEGNSNDRRALHLALLYAGAVSALDSDARQSFRPDNLKTDAATARVGERSDSKMAVAVAAALKGDTAQLIPLFNLGVEATALGGTGAKSGDTAPKSESYAVEGAAVDGFRVKVKLGLSEKTFTLTRASEASLVDRWTKAGDPDNAMEASPYRDLIAYECIISKDWSAGAKAMVNAYLSTNGRPKRAKLGASEL